MPRSPEELARFRGDDKAYAEGWDRIFGKKETKEESEKTEKDEDEKEE